MGHLETMVKEEKMDFLAKMQILTVMIDDLKTVLAEITVPQDRLVKPDQMEPTDQPVFLVKMVVHVVNAHLDQMVETEIRELMEFPESLVDLVLPVEKENKVKMAERDHRVHLETMEWKDLPVKPAHVVTQESLVRQL